jgi:hypothetical protein
MSWPSMMCCSAVVSAGCEQRRESRYQGTEALIERVSPICESFSCTAVLLLLSGLSFGVMHSHKVSFLRIAAPKAGDLFVARAALKLSSGSAESVAVQKRACGKSAINTFKRAFYGIVRTVEHYLDTVEAI